MNNTYNGKLKKQSQCKAWKQQKIVKQTSRMSYKTFDNDLVATRKNKVTLTLNKPAYIGISILELNRVLMYEFRYDYIKNKYGIKARLILLYKNFFRSALSFKTKIRNPRIFL